VAMPFMFGFGDVALHKRNSKNTFRGLSKISA